MQISNYWGQFSKRSLFGDFCICLINSLHGREARVHFPNSGWYIEPANTAVPRRSSPTRAEFLRGTPLATGSERRRLNMSRLIKSNFDRHFLLFLTNILNISSPQERVTLEKTAEFIVTNIICFPISWQQMMDTINKPKRINWQIIKQAHMPAGNLFTIGLIAMKPISW